MMFDFHTHDLQCAAGLVSVGVDELPLVCRGSLELHPWHLPSFITSGWRAAAQNAAAIGEIGLDKLRGAPWDRQLALFVEALAIADSLQKPVVIHCVRAAGEITACCQKYPEMPKLIHNFNSKVSHLQQFFERGFFVSFGAESIQRPEYLSLLRQYPDRIGFETDDGKDSIDRVYSLAAAALGRPLAEITALGEYNFCNFLGI